MGEIENHLNSALSIVQSAKSKLSSYNTDSNDSGGIGGWFKDLAESGINTAQNGWDHVPGNDFIEEKVSVGVDLGLNATAEIKDRLLDIDVKGAITDTVTTTAEIAHEGYEKLAELADEHPRIAGVLEGSTNFFIDGLAEVAEKGVDKNPETMGWEDLGAIWLLETEDVGGNGVILFDESARTTQDLMQQEGVQNTRNKVMEAIANGGEMGGSKGWTYGVDGYYDSLRERNSATIFLGSYTTKYFITDNGDGTYTVDYTVNNTSGLESGTRFRVDNDGDDVHDGIIPNKDQGDGLHLGGTISQQWKWSETITAEELENFQN